MAGEQPKAWLKGRDRPPVAIESLGIALGCFLMALGFHLFMNANGIVGGGVVGLSTVANRQLGWEPGLFQWAVNLPLLGLGFWLLGKVEGLQNLLGTLLLPLFIVGLKGLELATREPMLASLFGGVLYGAGLGLVLRNRGSVGGYSLLARLAVRKGLPVTVPGFILTLDSLTILASAGVFGVDKALYGLACAFVLRKVVDSVILGFNPAVVAMVVSKRPDEIRAKVLEEMDRGLTILPGEGGYTGEPRPVLMTVISRTQVPYLRSLVQRTDPQAFLWITPANEVQGSGFVRH